MKRTTLLVLSAIALMALAAQSAQAATILYAADFNSSIGGHTSPFNTPATDYANTNLVTASTSQDSWLNSSGLGTNALVVTNADTNGSVAMANNGEDDRATFTQATGDGTKVFLSMDITVSAALTGDYFASLGDGGTSNFNDRIYVKSSGTGFALAMSVNSPNPVGNLVYGADLSFGTTYHIVAEYDFVAGAKNDTGTLYLNPTDPLIGGDNTYVAALAGSSTINDPTQISGAYLRQGSATAAATLVVDNIAVATVPEPASLVLLGLGALGFIGAVRSRRSVK